MPLMTAPALGLPAPRIGKVREVFDLGEHVLIVATDRISAFDVVMANGIPEKGAILNTMSAFWFRHFGGVCPNHVIATELESIMSLTGLDLPESLRGRTTLARKADPLPIECVARGYLTGSLYKEYREDGPCVHGFQFAPNLPDSAKLVEPIFTPATKAQAGHDENISEARARDRVGAEVYEQVKAWTLGIYAAAAVYAEARGILLADTKFEFGLTEEGPIWIDEALTPDSSRFWDADRYEPGQAQPSYDKQFVRDYLDSIGWDKRPPGPILPAEVVTRTLEKYIGAYERLTGEAWASTIE
jgi:phosphoribosylaminoimidazole-succinocarboxamide synthase